MFTIFYKKPIYNPNRSYYQNQNRYAGSKVVNSLREVNEAVAEIKAQGGTITYVYDNCGRRVM